MQSCFFKSCLHPCLFWFVFQYQSPHPLSMCVVTLWGWHGAHPPPPCCTVLCEQQRERNLWESKGTSDQAGTLWNRATGCAEFGNRTRPERQMAHIQQWMNACYRQISCAPTSIHHPISFYHICTPSDHGALINRIKPNECWHVWCSAAIIFHISADTQQLRKPSKQVQTSSVRQHTHS